MKFAIIGCGGIGTKRMKALANHELVVAVDTNLARAQQLCQLAGTGIATQTLEAVLDANVDFAVVATINSELAAISIALLNKDINVLVEKPAGRNLKELLAIEVAEKNSAGVVKVGFNHRFHPAIQKAKQLVDDGALGQLMFIRGRYGHGGRIGYDKEWRADFDLSGGGELLDQGVHLIDLSRWFLGEFEHIDGFSHTYFWKTTVDDNGFVSLRTKNNQMAWLHVSCTEWKNMFSFEIYGKDAKLQIDGLGGSYGTERLTYYKMLPEMGPPETVSWEYPFADKSWDLEIDEFLDALENHRSPLGNLQDAIKAMEVVEEIYKKGERK